VPHHRRGRAAAVVALALLVAACGGGAKKNEAKSPTSTRGTTSSSQSTTTPPPLPPAWPLTGLPNPDPVKSVRPVLWVKIDNAPKARPQIGLNKADVLYEEMVEGGLTRFMAAFQSQDADPVGPVRSVRPVDPEIVTPLHGLFAYSGGAPKFVKLLRNAPVQDVGVDIVTGAYWRDRSRPAPDNQFTRTPQLFAAAAKDQPPAKPLFTYVRPGEPWPPNGVQAAPLNGVTLALPRITIDWDWNAQAGLWMRRSDGQPHVTTDGGQLAVTNVVLQFVPYDLSGDVDAGGNRVPYGNVIGKNKVWYLVGGKVYEGEWQKGSPGELTRYLDKNGNPMPLVPGRTAVVLVPTQVVPVTR
jgi:hypothetical protein